MDIATKLTDLTADLHECRRAITYRGGEISAKAGFKEVAEKIKTLPASSSVGTVIDEDISLLKLVPSNSTKYCYLKSLGGMTYKSNNLIPFPYAETTKTVNGITFTDNGDGTITLNGTAEAVASLNIVNMLEFPKGVYTISGFPSALSGKGYLAVVFNKDSTYVQEMTDRGSGATLDVTNLDFNNIRATLRLEAGAVCNNLVVKPMLNRGSTALPYEDYYEGLKDTKPTAIKSYRASGDLIKEYPIPEALQGTGKGIDNTYHDTIDFERGKAITEVNETILKSFNWTAANYGFYSYGLKNKFVGNNLLCSDYATDTWSNVYASKIDRCIAGNGSALIISDSRYTDEATFRDSLAEVKLMYATIEPTETDIDTSAFDPLIEVEGGGSIEIITDNGKAVPTTIIYQTIM